MRRKKISIIIAASLALATCSQDTPATTSQVADLSDYNIVDLTHAYGEDTVYWPNTPLRFEKTTIFEGAREDGKFYSAFSIAMPEHGGTHLDAPYHFDKDGDKTEAVPLEKLIAPTVVIDVSVKATADPLYRLTPSDILAFEQQNGMIPPGAIVLLRTDWSKRWPNAESYLGGTDPTALAFPSFGEDAAKLLINDRGAAALGVDTASTDYGPSTDFPVHRVMGASNAPGFENLTNLDRLPATGAYLVALPMKIDGGSGGPLRAVALVPEK